MNSRILAARHIVLLSYGSRCFRLQLVTCFFIVRYKCATKSPILTKQKFGNPLFIEVSELFREVPGEPFDVAQVLFALQIRKLYKLLIISLFLFTCNFLAIKFFKFHESFCATNALQMKIFCIFAPSNSSFIHYDADHCKG